MKSSIPSRFGPYEIVEPIGGGGMGDVYRARDTRLQRDVAVKTLRLAEDSDPARERRFLDEARAAGALNHPNILSVYDVGIEGVTPFLVTELIEGKQLRSEIDRGPVSLKRLLDLAAQIAAGLQAAHQAGFVHRDLKPENVMVTRDGRVKIVDFGLAKSVKASSSLPNADSFATRTDTAVIVGTVPYMSPEQAAGAEVDFHSDQFSLGLILYEMAAGRHPFRRDSAVQTLSAIIGEEPPSLADIHARVPDPLRWLIERCLAKDPAERYASTADLARDLAMLRTRLPEMRADAARAQPASRRRSFAVAGLIGLGIAFVALAVAAAVRPQARLLGAYTFTPLVTDDVYQGAPAWSPDGKSLAYVSQVDGVLQVFTRSLGSSGRTQVTDARFDCYDPFWSPEGTRIFYHSLARDKESLWSISAAGGEPRLEVENASRAALSPDGRTLYFSRQEAGGIIGGWRLWFASPPNADPVRYTQPPFDDSKYTHSDVWLRFAPDGSKLLAWVQPADTDRTRQPPKFWMLPLPAGQPREVLTSFPLPGRATASFEWFPDSRRIVMATTDATRGSHLWVADTERGTQEVLTATQLSENRPALSPDGNRLAFTSEAVDFDLIHIPLDGSPARPLLATSRSELDPAWSRDGSQYAFVWDRTGRPEIWVRSATGQFDRPIVTPDHFTDDTEMFGSLAFSPDGQRLAYQRLNGNGEYQVWISTVAAAGPPVRLAPGPTYQDAPTWSPDGSSIAYVQTYPLYRLLTTRIGGDGPRILVEGLAPESRPVWSPDGRWVLHDAPDGLSIVSPDGKDPRVISEDVWIAYAWGADSSRVYGLKEADRPRHYMMVSLDIATGKEEVVNPDLGVIPPANQPIRGFSRSGNQGFVTSIARARSEIWQLEGFNRPEGFLDRWRSLLGWR
jgi:Tol biopolymer transport system component